ncbi:MAG TPA: hypothetical protein VEC59_01670 [Steroidobacteraceae bacterium]|nr:hypothetical protein [Steroidobacteraceae bacterium]
MRIAVGLLACLGAGALTSALADPQIEAQAATAVPAATAAPAGSTPATPAQAAAPDAAAASQAAAAQAEAAKAAAAKVQLDKETQHFVAQGYRPEIRGGEQVYCKKETALGSRLSPVKYCGTIEELRLAEDRAKQGVSNAQRQQQTPQVH